ncbi:MAG: ABC transporter permease [Paracoccus sp. (in: a-proteobacteria)]|uniref:ABC transporter permease n=1 Tax=Paracoccus sp. TaxID=267 RepID=UPI0039E52DBC
MRAAFLSTLAYLPLRSWIGIALVVPVLLIGILGAWFSPYGPIDFVDMPLAPPSDMTAFGTDFEGHDVLSRFLHGGWHLLLIATLGSLGAVLLGSILGLAGGVFSGRGVDILYRVLDGVMMFPPLVLILVVMTGTDAGEAAVLFVLWLVLVPPVARIIRVAAVSVSLSDYFQAAVSIGTSRWRLLAQEIAPNVVPQMLALVPIYFTASLSLATAVHFLGYGVSPFNPDWGVMLAENQSGLELQPWGVVLPVMAIVAVCVGVNLVTDGLTRRYLDQSVHM